MIATKEQERKTLEKIKQMVAELGENSYLAAAFTGAFELAEQNIENDWGLTTQEYIDRAIKADDTEKRINEELAKTKTMLAAVQEAHRATTENFDATQERASKYAHEIDDLKATMNAKETEITILKAKLYDYMTAGK
jgi:septal ring factor EnvC (AmiA/AmiB activator)